MMIDWWKKLRKTHAKPAPIPAPTKPYLDRVPGTARTVCSWRGNVLPPAIHTLRIEHLRAIAGEDRKPWKAFPTATHHLWVIYRLTKDSSSPIVLVSQQYDFELPGEQDFHKTPDWVANRVGLWLAQVMLSCPEWWLLRHSSNPTKEAELAPHRDYFWAEAVDRQYKRLSLGE